MVTQGIDVVRVGYSDLIGTDRGRDVLVNRFARTVGDGVAFCRSVYATTPMGDVVDIEGGLEAGLPDVLAFPDVSTVHVVPWEPGVAHVIADVYNPDGSPSEESPRMVLKRVIQQFADLGMQPIVGPELEFYVLEHTDKNPTGWQRYGEATGNVYVAGLKGDPENVLLRTLRHLSAFGLDVVAANHEFSSGQFEINLWHSEALDAADRAFRFKSAIQELARQEDKLATFMAKPSTTKVDPDSIFTSPPGMTPVNRCSTTRKPKTGSRRPVSRRSPECSRTRPRWLPSATRPSTPTSARPRHPRSLADRLGV